MALSRKVHSRILMFINLCFVIVSFTINYCSFRRIVSLFIKFTLMYLIHNNLNYYQQYVIVGTFCVFFSSRAGHYTNISIDFWYD